MSRLIIAILALSIPCLAYAAGGGIGDFASTLMEPTGYLLKFVKTASIFIGLFCLFSAVIRYLQHRVNPLAHPWSIIILLFVIGVVLICLPNINLLGDHLPYFLRG